MAAGLIDNIVSISAAYDNVVMLCRSASACLPCAARARRFHFTFINNKIVF